MDESELATSAAASGDIGLVGMIVLGVCALFGLILLFGTFFTVKQQTVAVIERFGKYVRQARAGLNLKIPLIESVVDHVSLRIQELVVEVETKTKDNVIVNVNVSVQYFVMPEKVTEAFYKLANPTKQIESYVFDVVRAQIPSQTLDEVFINKDAIATAVKKELSETMDDFGYGITNALVTDIDPDETVKSSMNAINAAARRRRSSA
jgi:regulator of protease activity HflC (stomatin/prohibitin superfamily)